MYENAISGRGSMSGNRSCTNERTMSFRAPARIRNEKAIFDLK
jgi:hypothetical protein